jgi:hypothetical protein
MPFARLETARVPRKPISLSHDSFHIHRHRVTGSAGNYDVDGLLVAECEVGFDAKAMKHRHNVELRGEVRGIPALRSWAFPAAPTLSRHDG